MQDELKSVIGKRVRSQRVALGLSREKFAEFAEIHPQFLSEIEHGRKAMSVESLYKVCLALNISPEYILFGAEREKIQASPISQKLEKLYATPYITYLEQTVDLYHAMIETIKNEKAEEA